MRILLLFLSVCMETMSFFQYHIGRLSPEYNLSTDSEEYNTIYLFHENNLSPKNQNGIQYIPVSLPQSFVVELGSLANGCQSALVYNDNIELIISKYANHYYVDGVLLEGVYVNEKKISLYFVNNKIVFYIDDYKVGERRVYYDYRKKVGIKWSKKEPYSYYFMNCYFPQPFQQMNYGHVFEKDMGTQYAKSVQKQNVGKHYSLTFPTQISNNSLSSIRFEYRFDDSKDVSKSKTARGRSEISGVQAKSPMNKWIIEFDIYVPHTTADDPESTECITQLHEGFSNSTVPAFNIGIDNGFLYCRIRGDSVLRKKADKIYPLNTYTKKLCYLKKERWYHIKALVKEGYQSGHIPLTKIWIDNELVFESNRPNCYHYVPSKEGRYNYIKFGIYKSKWLSQKGCNPKTKTRVYYFDNYTVKY